MVESYQYISSSVCHIQLRLKSNSVMLLYQGNRTSQLVAKRDTINSKNEFLLHGRIFYQTFKNLIDQVKLNDFSSKIMNIISNLLPHSDMAGKMLQRHVQYKKPLLSFFHDWRGSEQKVQFAVTCIYNTLEILFPPFPWKNPLLRQKIWMFPSDFIMRLMIDKWWFVLGVLWGPPCSTSFFHVTFEKN